MYAFLKLEIFEFEIQTPNYSCQNAKFSKKKQRRNPIFLTAV